MSSRRNLTIAGTAVALGVTGLASASSGVASTQPGVWAAAGDTIATPTDDGPRNKKPSDITPCFEPQEGSGWCAFVIYACKNRGGSPQKVGDTWYCRDS
jgi:hypothetical protein